MRANQPMGLKAVAHDLLEGLFPIDSGSAYEGYWEERYPLVAYVAPDAAMTAVLAERAALAARVAELDAELTAAGQAMFAAGGFAYVEYQQDVLFSSGPVMFLALRGPDGLPTPASLWSTCEMEVGAEGVCRCGGAECHPGCAEDCLEREPSWED